MGAAQIEKRSALILSLQKQNQVHRTDRRTQFFVVVSGSCVKITPIELRSIRADVPAPAVAEVATSTSDPDAAAPTSASTTTPATAAKTAAPETPASAAAAATPSFC